MASEKRVWHLHVVTAHRMTESQFTELKGVYAVETPTLNDLSRALEKAIEKEFAIAYGSVSVPGTTFVIPEAVHFNIEVANVEEGRPL